MKLEVGKRYVCKNAPGIRYVDIIHHVTATAYEYNFVGIEWMEDESPFSTSLYSIDGDSEIYEYRLLREYQEPEILVNNRD